MADALLVASSFLPGRGGIETYLADLCRNVEPRLAVLAQSERDGRNMPSNLGYPVVPVPRRLKPDRRLITDIVDSARQHKTNKILFGSAWPLPLIAPELRRHGMRYSIVIHGAELFVPAAIPFIRARLRHVLEGAEVLYPVSAFTEHRLRRYLREGQRTMALDTSPSIRRMRVIIDTKRLQTAGAATPPSPSLGAIPPDARIVLHVGRLVKRKGIDRLIRTFPEIAENVPNALLVVVGVGPQESALRRLALRKGANVIFMGSISDEDVATLYARAHVFALPVSTRWFGLEFEGLGIVLLEAAACRTPSVVGKSGGTNEAVVDGVTGLVIDGRSTAQIVEKIVLLLSNDALRERMGNAALDYVTQNFSAATAQTGLTNWLNS